MNTVKQHEASHLQSISVITRPNNEEGQWQQGGHKAASHQEKYHFPVIAGMRRKAP